MAGNLKTVKTLVAGFPVIVETWFVTGEKGGMGHHRLVNGYDDKQGVLRALDSYDGPKMTMRYADFEPLWEGFENTYLLIVPRGKTNGVRSILRT